jgi:hypothetical protein
VVLDKGFGSRRRASRSVPCPRGRRFPTGSQGASSAPPDRAPGCWPGWGR